MKIWFFCELHLAIRELNMKMASVRLFVRGVHCSNRSLYEEKGVPHVQCLSCSRRRTVKRVRAARRHCGVCCIGRSTNRYRFYAGSSHCTKCWGGWRLKVLRLSFVLPCFCVCLVVSEERKRRRRVPEFLLWEFFYKVLFR